MLSFVRHCQTVFQSGCTILHFHQQWMRASVAPHPHQHLVLSETIILKTFSNLILGFPEKVRSKVKDQLIFFLYMKVWVGEGWEEEVWGGME